jgi:heme exporter protein C
MRRIFIPLLVLAAAMFAYSPIIIANAPFEATMGLVQKIFYYHVPSWMVMFSGVFICGIASAVHLYRPSAAADRLALSAAELTVLFGLIGLITGPLWGRKAWGVWWQWDARLTMSLLLWLIFVAYLLVRRYAGAGADKLSAALAVFGMANVPFVYISVNIWRTIHPNTSVVTTLGPGMRGAFWWCAASFMVLMVLALAARMKLERQRTALDDLYLALED